VTPRIFTKAVIERHNSEHDSKVSEETRGNVAMHYGAQQLAQQDASLP
jgi:hypothetical protein